MLPATIRPNWSAMLGADHQHCRVEFLCGVEQGSRPRHARHGERFGFLGQPLARPLETFQGQVSGGPSDTRDVDAVGDDAASVRADGDQPATGQIPEECGERERIRDPRGMDRRR